MRLSALPEHRLISVYLVAVALHLLAAVAWVGGSMFLVGVLGPALRTPEMRAHAPALMRSAGRRFRTLTYSAFATFVLTGALLLAHRGFLVTPLLGLKLVLVAATFAIAGVHDFWVGPAATAAARRGDTIGSARWRRRATWLGRGNLAMTTVVVVLSVAVARGG